MRILLISCGLILMTALTGCQTGPAGVPGLSRIMQLGATGKHGLVLNEFKNGAENYKQFDVSDHMLICDAYANLGQFRDFGSCMELVKPRIDNGAPYLKVLDSKHALPRYFSLLGGVSSWLGKHEDTIKLLYKSEKSSEEIFGRPMAFYSANLATIANSHMALGNVQAAQSLIEPMLDTARITSDPATYSMRWQIDMFIAPQFAGALTRLGRYDESIALLDRRVSKPNNPMNRVLKNNPDLARSVTGLRSFHYAQAYWGKRDLEKAEKYIDEVISNSKTIGIGGIRWIALHIKGKILRDKGNETGAITFFEEALSVIENQRSTLNISANKIGFVADKQAVYGDTVKTYLALKDLQNAFRTVERAKARALVDMLASKTFFKGRKNSVQVKKILEELDLLEKQSSIRVAIANGTDVRSSSNETRALSDLRQRISTLSPELASVTSVTVMSVQEIQAQLRPDEALLEFYGSGQVDENPVYAFIVTSSDVKVHALKTVGLNADIQSFRAAINMHNTRNWEAWSDKLYRRVIKPIKKLLKGKNHLTIVPHGALHYVPFNALRPKGGRFLIENYSLRLLPSVSVLKFLNKGTAPTQSLLVFGNPDLGNPHYDLAGAQAEAQAIARLWTDSKVMLRKNASETLLKKSAGAFKYIHLASHGQFNPDEPMKSRMLLAPDDINDGNLTVPEIYDLKLNADMVVLSACETALGDVKQGDDIVGLNHGFLYAGAKSVVGSLWEVPDNPTQDLMLDLYQKLKKMDLREAMQKAQIKALKKYKHPVSWAAFQVTGGR